jgi:Protein of unknown function (DUF3105)
VRSIGRWPAAGASALALTALTIGCATNNQTATPPTDAAIDVPQIIDGSVDGVQCTTTIELHADEGATHVPCTTAVDYQTEPPSSGNHYQCWAAYQTYTSPIPWGNLVHSLEHGAIVFVYNCPEGCAADVANLQAFIDGLPLDSDCAPTLGKNRIILMPDPDPALGVRFAASSWDWTLRADCFDPAAFRRFFDDHYDHGREVICSDGAPPADLCSDVCL